MLNVARTNFGDGGLKILSKSAIMKSLHVLDATQSKLTSHGMLYLTRFPGLDTAILGHTALDDDAISPIAKCQRLDSLNLSYTHITGRNLQELKVMPHLINLDLSGDHDVVDHLQNLKELKLQKLCLNDCGVGRRRY